MKRILAIALFPVAALLGCGDDATITAVDSGPGAPDLRQNVLPDMTATGDMAMVPAAPTLGAQIDRMGRPTINVAVTNPFDLDLHALNAAATGRDATRDAYNQDSDPASWGAHWSGVLAANLAIYDGADTVCGNQLLADKNIATPARYAPLGGVLADDRLYLDTAQTTCGFYLAVEANAALKLGLQDCGGRTPNESVVDETYTFATVGITGLKQDGSFAITDGPTANAEGKPSLTTFPFLNDPN